MQAAYEPPEHPSPCPPSFSALVWFRLEEILSLSLPQTGRFECDIHQHFTVDYQLPKKIPPTPALLLSLVELAVGQCRLSGKVGGLSLCSETTPMLFLLLASGLHCRRSIPKQMLSAPLWPGSDIHPVLVVAVKIEVDFF